MNSPRGSQLLTIVHKLKHLNFTSALGLMPPSEIMLLAEISKLIKNNPENPVTASDARGFEARRRRFQNAQPPEERYIERVAHPGDRRNVSVILTDEGTAAFEEDMNKIKPYSGRCSSQLHEIMQMTTLFDNRGSDESGTGQNRTRQGERRLMQNSVTSNYAPLRWHRVLIVQVHDLRCPTIPKTSSTSVYRTKASNTRCPKILPPTAIKR